MLNCMPTRVHTEMWQMFNWNNNYVIVTAFMREETELLITEG